METKIGYANRILVTQENIADLKTCGVPRDQSDELTVGCETWGILFGGNQRGQITVWPEAGRAAIEFGGMSEWGEWIHAASMIRTDDGIAYDADGHAAEDFRRERIT